MSRRPPPKRNGLKLPRQLQQELGLSVGSGDGTRRGSERGGSTRRRRKDGRKAAREDRAVGTSGNARRLSRSAQTVAGDNDMFRDGEDEEEAREGEQRRNSQPAARLEPGPQTSSNMAERKPKSILKHPLPPAHASSPAQDSERERSPSPGLVLDKSARSFQDRAAQDDAEIKALEKKLGLRTKRLPKSFEEDGLADLLEGIDGGDEGRKRKREGHEWLDRKRKRVGVGDDIDHKSRASASGEDAGGSDLEAGDPPGDGSEAIDSDENDFSGFGSTHEEANAKPALVKRENPYIPPVSDTAKPATKYIPPSLRKPTSSEAQSLHRLRRQIQGQLNKLSEANLLTILAEVEKLYQTNVRQDVTSTLIDLLLSLFCDPSVLQNTFVILHASFAAAMYKVVGTDFGAEFVCQLVHRFESFHKRHELADGKQCVNLVSLLAHLYTFHLISSNLVFDHIRILLGTLSETNAELLLRVLRDAGPQLRQDDPSSLKDIVLLMQKSAASAQAEGASISVRTKFMMETITDLKNNKLRSDVASTGVAGEHITRMRKVLGTLNSRNIRASEPLRIGLSDVKNADKHGKWWLIGASWKEKEAVGGPTTSASIEQINSSSETSDAEEADLLILARQHRMNTAVRRAIFIAIMSATDYQDAHLRLVKLHLKRSQEQEIPRVVMHCAAAEEKYNPYYTLIAKALCVDKRAKMAFQFGLWDFFKRLGEKTDDLDDANSDDGDRVELKEIVNTARMFGNLIADGTMSLGILKTLNLTVLKEQGRMFVEVLLIVVISKSQEGPEARAEDVLAKIFARCKDTPQIIGGLRHFLKRVVKQTDLASSEVELRLIRWGCGVAIDTLRVVSAGHMS